MGYLGMGEEKMGAREWVRGLFLEWWKCSKITLRWWSHNSVNMLKIIGLYTLKGLTLWYINVKKAIRNYFSRAQYQVISSHSMWLLSSRINMKTRCVVNKPYPGTKCSTMRRMKTMPMKLVSFPWKQLTGLQPLSQMSLGKCWMVLAFDFYQTRNNGNIHSSLLKCF